VPFAEESGGPHSNKGACIANARRIDVPWPVVVVTAVRCDPTRDVKAVRGDVIALRCQKSPRNVDAAGCNASTFPSADVAVMANDSPNPLRLGRAMKPPSGPARVPGQQAIFAS